MYYSYTSYFFCGRPRSKLNKKLPLFPMSLCSFFCYFWYELWWCYALCSVCVCLLLRNNAFMHEAAEVALLFGSVAVKSEKERIASFHLTQKNNNNTTQRYNTKHSLCTSNPFFYAYWRSDWWDIFLNVNEWVGWVVGCWTTGWIRIHYFHVKAK